MDYVCDLKRYIALEIEALQKIDLQKVNDLMHALDSVRKRNATVYVMGNGGSASTASHMANDFNKGLSEHLEQKFRTICLNDNIATVLAIANDIGFNEIFAFQLHGKLSKDDLVIGISGSGNSQNVIKAIEYAKSVGTMTVGITGFNGGKLNEVVDISVNVPVMSMQITEDVHLVLNHLITAVFYEALCGINHMCE